MNNLCEICNGEQHDPHDHPFLPKMQEHHNPLDIPFGHEIHEVNNNIKDVDEGGIGSGRHKTKNFGSGGGGGDAAGGSSGFDNSASTGAQPGELVTFETTSIPNSASSLSIKKPIEGVTEIMKQVMDSKLSCPCKNKTI
jgi:hypothetical protein